jgi:LPS-assembly protein
MGRFGKWILILMGLLLGIEFLLHVPSGSCQGTEKERIKSKIPAGQLKLPEPDMGEGLPIHIQADSISYSRREDRYVAEGNVEITRGAMTLRADKVVMDNKTRLVTAQGNVEVIQDKGGNLQSEHLEMNIDDKTGRITNGTIVFPRHNLIVTGEVIERLDEERYRLTGATITTCSGETPDWRFSAREIELTVAGDALVKDATFDVRKVPIMYVPYFVYPARKERETGFLMPYYQSNDHTGFGASLPFFWAFDESWDATFTQTYFSESGYQQGAELRYFPTENLHGMLRGQYIRDMDDSDMEVFRGGQPRDKKDRWRFEMEQLWELPLGIKSKTDIDVVSDNYYLEDFFVDSEERHLRYLTSTVNATKNAGTYLTAGELRYYRNLNAPNDDNGETVQRLPSLLFHRAEIPIFGSPIALGWDVVFDNFWRQEGSTGEILKLAPALAIPIPLGSYFTVVPFARCEENIFWANNDPESDAFGRLSNYDYGVSITSAELARVFPISLGSLQGIQHSFQSELRFDAFNSMTDGDYPIEFLTPFEDEDLLTLDVVQFLMGKFLDREGSAKTREIARLQLTQSYRTQAENTDEPFLPLVSSLEMRLLEQMAGHFDLFLDLDGRYDWYRNGRDALSVTLRGNDDWGDELHVLYDLDNNMKTRLNLGTIAFLDLQLDGWYSFKDSRWVRYGYGFTFYAGCWAINFSHSIQPGFQGRDTDQSFQAQVYLRGLGSLFSF